MASTTQIKAQATGVDNEIRMILLGKTGAGKSSVGNTILGAKLFEAKLNPNGVTKQCGSATRDFEQKRLFVVDTPGFLDPTITEAAIQEEVALSR
ncbi:unnamed protein product [Rotaria sordida]|uniref:AIG1-type G domain-containing protein n=1 Tax=Rotaria sordida TaxID=392033 RepID=A0A813WYD4_9BILA|nr:unnamed protein product [Rotaria sordida]CAF0919578.1 unnamed protein product [Rotaria sordida]CAF0927673.1 unnamed protein product [Rotaria sordida]